MPKGRSVVTGPSFFGHSWCPSSGWCPCRPSV